MYREAKIKIILGCVIFIVSITAYYYPVYQKGFAPGADHQNLMMARNFTVSGTFKVEDSKGVLLSSKNAATEGKETGIFNPLTPIIYGYIFKYFGFDYRLPLFVSITLFGLFNVLVFLIISRLFSVTVGFMSGIASALMPVMSVGAVHGGFYEWAMLFFGFGLLSYFGSKTGPFNSSNVRVFISSIFFGLSALARNAFAISFIPFFIYDFLSTDRIKEDFCF